MSKFLAFFANFFHNAKSDPVNTGKGLVLLAVAGGVAYLGATGKMDPYAANTMAGGFATSGLHAIGTDTTTQTVDPEAEKAISAVATISAAAPVALDIVGQFQAARAKADAAQGDIALYAQMASALAPLLPVAQATAPIAGLIRSAPVEVAAPFAPVAAG